jgi:hypothetical protein
MEKQYPLVAQVLTSDKDEKTALKKYKGFDILQVSGKPGEEPTYMLFDIKYNSKGRQEFHDIEDAKKAADKLFQQRIQHAGYKAIAALLVNKR